MQSSVWVFLIIVLSSLFWSLFDTSRKSLSDHLSATAAVFWLMLLQAPIFLLLVFTEAWVWPSANYWLPAAISLLLNLLSNIWFVEAVRLAPLSLAIPILALTPVFSATGGLILLGEATSLRQACGILVIVTATFVLGRHSARNQLDEMENARVRRGLILMVVVALLFALTPVFDKICLREMPSSEHAFLQCLSVAITAAIYLRSRRQGLDFSAALISRCGSGFCGRSTFHSVLVNSSSAGRNV